jgi:L-gulonate 5-dehydrogenase
MLKLSGGRIVILGLVKQSVTVTLPGLDFTRKEMTLRSRHQLDGTPPGQWG